MQTVITISRKDGFSGWSKGSSNYTGSETAANLNSGNAKSVTVKAKWKSNCNDGISSVGGSKNFDYTGSVQTFNACAGRYYKLEVWGAQGGGSNGGLGGYAVGVYNSTANQPMYVFVGGKGNTFGTSTGYKYGGWNGGGGFYIHSFQMQDSERYSGTGGGGTDISLASSSVTTDSYYRYVRTSASYDQRIIVAGGGGGGNHDNAASYASYGGHGGGYIGGTDLDDDSRYNTYLGTQTSAGVGVDNSSHSSGGGPSWSSNGSKGYAGSSSSVNHCCCSASGGGGYYGGGGTYCGHMAATGGSGYINSSSLLTAKGITKQMYQYNANTTCQASSAAATKTTCTSNSSSAATSNYAKLGNGYARITYLGT